MSQMILQKRTILCRLNRFSSTDRLRHRLMILLKASGLPLLNRIWTMSKYGPCWLHHCTYRREKQVLTDHEFTTPQEKTPCQVHLTFERVWRNPQRTGKPVALFSNKRDVESRSTFRKRRFFLTTSTGSRKQRTSIQILQPGKFDEIIS